MIKTLEAQAGQFLLVVEEQDPLGELPAAVFLQNVLQLHHQRLLIHRLHNLALWKVIIGRMPS